MDATTSLYGNALPLLTLTWRRRPDNGPGLCAKMGCTCSKPAGVDAEDVQRKTETTNPFFSINVVESEDETGNVTCGERPELAGGDALALDAPTRRSIGRLALRRRTSTATSSNDRHVRELGVLELQFPNEPLTPHCSGISLGQLVASGTFDNLLDASEASPARLVAGEVQAGDDLEIFKALAWPEAMNGIAKEALYESLQAVLEVLRDQKPADPVRTVGECLLRVRRYAHVATRAFVSSPPLCYAQATDVKTVLELNIKDGAVRVQPLRTSCRVRASDVQAVMQLEAKDVPEWSSADVHKVEDSLTGAMGMLVLALPSDPVRALGELMVRTEPAAGGVARPRWA